LYLPQLPESEGGAAKIKNKKGATTCRLKKSVLSLA
jgi:hypothetical protein